MVTVAEPVVRFPVTPGEPVGGVVGVGGTLPSIVGGALVVPVATGDGGAGSAFLQEVVTRANVRTTAADVIVVALA